MSLRSPNKDWPKEFADIYNGQFLSDCNSGRFVVPNELFSNFDILDCLETEINSAEAIVNLIQKLICRKINSILVVGCGSGRLASQIRKFFTNINLVEIDKNNFVIERLQKKHENDFLRKSYCADACAMPFENNSFDVVVCYCVFRYISSLEEAINESFRVVKKNGLVLIAEAKNISIIEKIKEILIRKNIFFEKKTIPSVRLPHLTFYYYLLVEFLKNGFITNLINSKKKENANYFSSTFEFAGSSLGSIYTLILKK